MITAEGDLAGYVAGKIVRQNYVFATLWPYL